MIVAVSLRERTGHQIRSGADDKTAQKGVYPQALHSPNAPVMSLVRGPKRARRCLCGVTKDELVVAFREQLRTGGSRDTLQLTQSSTLSPREWGINLGGKQYVVREHTAGGDPGGSWNPEWDRLGPERPERRCSGPDDRGGSRR